jgi:hypothetical protein
VGASAGRDVILWLAGESPLRYRCRAARPCWSGSRGRRVRSGSDFEQAITPPRICSLPRTAWFSSPRVLSPAAGAADQRHLALRIIEQVLSNPDPRFEAFAAREPYFAVVTDPKFLRTNSPRTRA